MASGTIYGVTSNQYIDAKVIWATTTNKEKNQSTVTAALYYKRNNTGYTTSGTGTFSVTINGVRTSETKSITITGDDWVKAASGITTVSHDSNGAKSIIISAAGTIPDTTLSYTSLMSSVALDTIPRASTIDSLSCSSSYFNGALNYKYTPKNANLYNQCSISLNINGTLSTVRVNQHGQKATSQQTSAVEFSERELATIYEKLPSATKGTLRFTFLTYSDSGYEKQVGAPTHKEITLNIPDIDSTKPTATVTLNPVSSISNWDLASFYIKGKTMVEVAFTDVVGKYGASIVSRSMSVNGKNYGSPYRSDFLTQEGDITVTSTITDSRGFSRSYKKTIKVYAYEAPKILPASNENEIICARCDADGNLTDSGTYLKIKARRSFSLIATVVPIKNYNRCEIQYRYKEEGGAYSSWETILAPNASSNDIETEALLGGTLSTQSSYYVQLRAIDTVGDSSTTTIDIPTERVFMHRSGTRKSIGIGKYAEEDNTVDIADDITTKFRGKVQFVGEEWRSLGLSEAVTESESNCGRWSGTGCHYRVCAGEKHIYIAFNCAFAYANSAIQVNAEPIPEAYRPDRNVYAICATGGRAIARILVNKDGNILVDWIQVISSAEATASATVNWIDGYIDYWT